MRSFIVGLRSEDGNVTIIAFILLVVLTLIGIFATRTAQIELQTAYNEIPYKQNFYIAEGGVNREAAELGTGSPSNVGIQDADRELLGKPYKVSVDDLGAFLPPKGYSAVHFSRYDYSIEAKAGGSTSSGQVRVASRFYKIGPKTE